MTQIFPLYTLAVSTHMQVINISKIYYLDQLLKLMINLDSVVLWNYLKVTKMSLFGKSKVIQVHYQITPPLLLSGVNPYYGGDGG